jgi:hypothetical protein
LHCIDPPVLLQSAGFPVGQQSVPNTPPLTPSSRVPSQSSSMLLHVSALGPIAPVHDPYVGVGFAHGFGPGHPGDPAGIGFVVQVCVPATHGPFPAIAGAGYGKQACVGASFTPSQLLSSPLHAIACGPVPPRHTTRFGFVAFGAWLRVHDVVVAFVSWQQ